MNQRNMSGIPNDSKSIDGDIRVPKEDTDRYGQYKQNVVKLIHVMIISRGIIIYCLWQKRSLSESGSNQDFLSSFFFHFHFHFFHFILYLRLIFTLTFDNINLFQSWHPTKVRFHFDYT